MRKTEINLFTFSQKMRCFSMSLLHFTLMAVNMLSLTYQPGLRQNQQRTMSKAQLKNLSSIKQCLHQVTEHYKCENSEVQVTLVTVVKQGANFIHADISVEHNKGEAHRLKKWICGGYNGKISGKSLKVKISQK